MTNDSEVSVILIQPKETKDDVGTSTSFPPSATDDSENDTYRVNLPSNPIEVIQSYPDWCILSVLRGKGPRAVEEWIASNQRLCFDPPVNSHDMHDDDADHKSAAACEPGDGSIRLIPTLINPNNAACAHSLVLATRHPSLLAKLRYLRVTAHCLVKGYHKPGTKLQLSNVIEGKPCRTDAICLQVIPSNSLGHISLLEVSSEQQQKQQQDQQASDDGSCRISSSSSTYIVPRQFQRHLQAGGWPLLGATRDCHAFRGEKMCLSLVGLDFEARGIHRRQSVTIPPIPRLKNILTKEERFWKQRHENANNNNDDNHDTIHHQASGTIRNEIPKPTEYIEEKAMFDGLEFRVTPVAMIPRKGTEALVEIVDRYVANQPDLIGREPFVLDLGTGCGNLLLAILKRLAHCNARGVGLDARAETLELCNYNATALGMSHRATFLQGQFAEIQFLQLLQPVDVVVCNPPYMTKGGRRNLDAATTSYEPETALFVDRNDPNIHYQHVLDGLIQGNLLVSGALLVFEVCKENAEPIKRMMIDRGFINVEIGRDWKACIRTVHGLYHTLELKQQDASPR